MVVILRICQNSAATLADTFKLISINKYKMNIFIFENRKYLSMHRINTNV
jgi:hypothetical protein